MQSRDFYLLIYWNNLLGSRISKVLSNREDLFEYLNQNFIVSDKDTIDNVIDFGEPIRINDNSYYYVKQVPFIQGEQTVRPGNYVCILANKLDKTFEFSAVFSDKDVLEEYLKDDHPELSAFQRKRLIAGNRNDDLDVGYVRLYK
mgnify:CR=1 FL=1